MRIVKGEARPCSVSIRVHGLSYVGTVFMSMASGFGDHDLMFSRSRFCILSLWNIRLPLIAGFPIWYVSCVPTDVFQLIWPICALPSEQGDVANSRFLSRCCLSLKRGVILLNSSWIA
jgi:hypothetical protein